MVTHLLEHRYFSVSQIKRLRFPSLQTAYRRLRALTSGGYARGFLAPHITEHIYHLAPSGAETVAAHLGVAVHDLKWAAQSRPPKDYYFLRHFIAVNDFRIALAEACTDSPEVSLRGFIPEYFGERSRGEFVTKYIRDVVCDMSRSREEFSHTPDAVFALDKSNRTALFFLEIDRGTEVVGNAEKGVLKCVRFYLNYLTSGGYARYAKDFGCEEPRGFRALIVTTSEKRVRNIREAVGALPLDERAKRFIWLSEFAQVERETMFSAVWRAVDA